MFIADRWRDFEVLDAGDGEKLERWGDYILRRPDPQVIWRRSNEGAWQEAHARYIRSDKGGGAWEQLRKLPERWEIGYGQLKFQIHPTNFKHTGLFPEQAANWDWMQKLIKSRKNARVLNLFAYTGGATVACAQAGAHVTHVDAAKGMTLWAKENRALSNVPETQCRFIVEDALAFVKREIRRGSKYDAILMDPPSYGRGPSGEVWKLEDTLYSLIDTCVDALSDQPLFFLLNSYTTGLQPLVLDNLLRLCLKERFDGHIDAQELALPVASGGLLPCGASGRWQFE